MSLLSPPPEPSNKSKVWTFTIAALAVALAIVLYFSLRYYPEKKAAEHFLDALVAGNTNQAYQLWKPSPSPDKSDIEKSRRTKQLNVWVNSDDKSFSFPPSF